MHLPSLIAIPIPTSTSTSTEIGTPALVLPVLPAGGTALGLIGETFGSKEFLL